MRLTIMARSWHPSPLGRTTQQQASPPRTEHPIERMLRLLAAAAIIMAGLYLALSFIGMVLVFTAISFLPTAH
jgi:hypothetical protein